MAQYTTQKSRQTARLIVSASDTDANMLWATGMFAPDPFVFIQARGKRYLVMSDLEVDRAREEARVDVVLPQRDYVRRLQSRGIEFPSMSDVIAAVFRDLGIRSARVPSDFPLGLADQLRDRGFALPVQANPFWPEREIKRKDEVASIRASLRAAEAGLAAGIEALKRTRITRDGGLDLDGTRLTSEMLRSVINTTIMSRGYVPSHTIVASGEQAVDPHNQGSGRIRAHTPIIIDIFPRSQSTGYFGDMTRTVVRGKASEPLKRAYSAVAEAQQLCFRQIRSRASAYRIHNNVLDHFRRKGFPTGLQDGRMQGFFHGTGHGLGLDIHEAPAFGLRARNRLRKDHVVTVEPGLYYSGMGGVRLEDVVVVTEAGCRNLVRFPKYLEV